MANKEFYTPEIDAFVGRFCNYGFDAYSRQDRTFASTEITEILEKLLESLQVIKPLLDGQDKVWSLWIRSKRGPMSAYIDDEEYEDMKESGEIQSPEDLESLREDYYPEEINWHKVSFRIYDNLFIFGFDSKRIFQLDIETKQIEGVSFGGNEPVEFLLWVLSNVETEINAALKNIEVYNDYIAGNLSLRKRFGKINRIQLWENVPGIERLDTDLGEANLSRFEIAVNNVNSEALISAMTADKFFQYCQLCYDANDYFKDKQAMTARAKYKEMADRRDEGLLDIVGDSEIIFNDWFQDKSRRGGHPWEICRGGNSTHISLIVQKKKDQWQLYLAGSSRTRVLETARMAIALSENDIPFILADAWELLRMLKGTDYCGIVPENVTPQYCHSYFPDEDKIIDFINPWHDKEVVEVIKKYATWYPVNRLTLA